MLTKRIIPCLDVRNGRVVKGVNFSGIKDVEDPVALAKYYNEFGADELVFYDITASAEGRSLFTDVLRRTAAEVFIPLMVGGGVNSVDDFDILLKCGADKVSVNSGAIKNPDIIYKRQSLRQPVRGAVMDVKRVDGRFTVFAKGGREMTSLDAVSWAYAGQETAQGRLWLTPWTPTG